VAIVKPINPSSRRVAEKAGFAWIRRVTLLDQAEYDYLVVHRVKPLFPRFWVMLQLLFDG
jgi:hypothetical protein